MDDATRKALEDSGYVFSDAEDFLELTPEEREMVQRRIDEEDVAEATLREIEKTGTIPWEQVKKDLGL